MNEWIQDDHLWIRRTAIIHQLKYKANTNEEMLFRFCKSTMEEEDFFIRKAIGWALREYSKTSNKPVKEFIESNKENLSKLSVREGSKYLK
mmetsp:Transcript_14133/g.17850  ORF Transcript_14133/g.17850 Transcript_14133/m.17850 type:complete len:91 (+) Transcript_14133:1252-1524(+)